MVILLNLFKVSFNLLSTLCLRISTNVIVNSQYMFSMGTPLILSRFTLTFYLTLPFEH